MYHYGKKNLFCSLTATVGSPRRRSKTQFLPSISRCQVLQPGPQTNHVIIYSTKPKITSQNSLCQQKQSGKSYVGYLSVLNLAQSLTKMSLKTMALMFRNKRNSTLNLTKNRSMYLFKEEKKRFCCFWYSVG